MFQTNFVEKMKIHILCSVLFLFLTLHEVMLRNIVEPCRPEMTICRMRFSRWVPKATNTFLEHVILIVFLLKQ
jgi:hypothetical protein